MIRIQLELSLGYEVDKDGADFVFNIHAARTRHQAVSAERLVVNQPIATRMHTDAATGNRFLRLRALPGDLNLTYAATVDLHHHVVQPESLDEVPVCLLPPTALGYIHPSRYCQSDRLLRFAGSAFGKLRQGHARVQAIRDWVSNHVNFVSNSSNASTSALDTLVEQVGVCRDFAHLMIALCRAVNIPARFASGTDFGADPILGPPDFHAYVEVYLGDRWYLFDPSDTAIPMGLVRLGTGRDAADVAVATIFGGVRSRAPVIHAMAVEDDAQGLSRPVRCREVLSTDDGGCDVQARAPQPFLPGMALPP